MSEDQHRTIAITSGKGGVGKSCVAYNLAVSVSRIGFKTLLVDTDFGLGSCSVLAGAHSEFTLEDILLGRCTPIDATIECPSGLCVLPASSNGQGLDWLVGRNKENVAKSLVDFERQFELIVVDTAAGLGVSTIETTISTDSIMLMVTPDPTAIADAYASLKMLYAHEKDLTVHLLANMVESKREAENLQVKFAQLADRFLGAQIENLGYIPMDRYVREGVKRQIPFATFKPAPPAAEAIELLATRWLSARHDNSSSFFERVLMFDNTESNR
ncbi:MAG: P-loop NTPase [Candidatus Latescibacterota bacterium]|nr:P-loop NTPase [Candidatus Latescibacterota bacterium]